MENAGDRAMRFIRWSESQRAARYLAPPSGSCQPVKEPGADPEAVAFVAAFEKARMPKREARAVRLLAHAERVATMRLGANVVTVRTIAGPLADYGFLDGQQLLELYVAGRRLQLEDDELWKGKRA
jgi:hypothetical protein